MQIDYVGTPCPTGLNGLIKKRLWKFLGLTLQTNNLADTKKFYQQTMGFTNANETKRYISFYVGTSKLVFELIHSDQNPKYDFAFNIPAQDR